MLKQNESYQALLREFDRVEAIKADFERQVREPLAEAGNPHIHDWRDDNRDPTPNHFRHDVRSRKDGTRPWQPFQRSKLTRKLADWLRTELGDEIDDMPQEAIEWQRGA